MAEIPLHTSSPVSASSSEEALVKDIAASTLNERCQEISHTNSSPDMEDVPLLLEEATARSTTLRFQATPAPSKKNVPRLNTRTSISSPSLPWQVDTTSSPASPSPYSRKASFVPPPRPGLSTYIPSASSSSSPPMPQLQPDDSPMSPSAYRHSSRYASTSGHVIDLSHPPGYAQNARASFSDRAPYGNQTPFYENNRASSFSSPITPTRRGRGILDNDPAIYLAGEGDGDEDSMWDTAAKWAKAAGKRLSQGEQQIWKLVSAIGNGDIER